MTDWKTTEEGKQALKEFLHAHKLTHCSECGRDMGWDNLRWTNDETEYGTGFTVIWVECSEGHENAETHSWYPYIDRIEEAAEHLIKDYDNRY
jgi:hypothetical protein